MEKGHEILIQKVMTIMRGNLSEPLSIVDLSKKVGYSPSHLRLVFRKATGKGILPHLLDLRMERAKRLLRDTNLTIGEIAFESGYTSYKCFGAAFRNKVGCSPGSFRRSQGIAVRSVDSRHTDKIDAPELTSHGTPERWTGNTFAPQDGEWKHEKDILFGSSSGIAYGLFPEPVPENFRIRFQAQLLSQAGLLSNEMGIGLDTNQTESSRILDSYYGFALGRMDGTFGEFRMSGVPLLINSKAVLKRDAWHDIEIELVEDTITLALDGVEMFRHRDPFPPPFARRSHLVLAITNGKLGVRKIEISDKGFLPLIKNVRQGDSLYNAGFFSSARDFYLRLLASKLSTADVMELRYKIGQCFFKEEDYSQARGWMGKVIEIPQTGFWADRAKLAVLEMDIREGQYDVITQSLPSLFEKDNFRQPIRSVLDAACPDLATRGFFENALLLRKLLLLLEEPDSHPWLVAKIEIAELLLQMRRITESEEHFTMVIKNPNTPMPRRMFALFSLCNNLGILGKRNEWAKVLEEMETLTAFLPADACRLSTSRAIYHRAQDEWELALIQLDAAYEQKGKIASWPLYSRNLKALLLCSLGKMPEARESAREAEITEPAHPRLSKGRRSSLYYPLELANGNYERAAEFLKEDSEAAQGTALGAEHGIKAGILLSLAGKQDDAIAIWKRTADLFPENRINFYGPFAKTLAVGKMEGAEAMAYPAEKRSEIFYLLGLLCEHTGDGPRAKAFFKSSVEEDRLMNWPAVMARNKLA